MGVYKTLQTILNYIFRSFNYGKTFLTILIKINKNVNCVSKNFKLKRP